MVFSAYKLDLVKKPTTTITAKQVPKIELFTYLVFPPSSKQMRHRTKKEKENFEKVDQGDLLTILCNCITRIVGRREEMGRKYGILIL